MLPLPLLLVSLAVLIAAAWCDLKTLEVPDWINYSGIAAGIGIHAIYSSQQWNVTPLTSSAIGLGIGFALACLMFYTGQWGGGDAKLLMAMGALIGFQYDKFSDLASFLINLVFAGGAWTIAMSIFYAIRKRHAVWNTFLALRNQHPYARVTLSSTITAALLVIAAIAISLVRTELLILAALVLLSSYLVLFIKSTELSAMHHWVSPNKLTEGDWLVHTIKIGNKQFNPPRLGLEKKDLKQLKHWYHQKKIDTVLVKYGVPFTPAFLISFLVTIAVGNGIIWIAFG